MRRRGLVKTALAALAAIAALFALAAPSHAVMDWPDLLSRPHPQPSKRIAYGSDPLQYADLWLPPG